MLSTTYIYDKTLNKSTVHWGSDHGVQFFNPYHFEHKFQFKGIKLFHVENNIYLRQG